MMEELKSRLLFTNEVNGLPGDLVESIREYRELNFSLGLSPGQLNWLSKACVLYYFRGGAFLVLGNKFDLMVYKNFRGGRWGVRSVMPTFLKMMFEVHDVIEVSILKNNHACLRLALFFGFQIVDSCSKYYNLELNKSDFKWG